MIKRMTVLTERQAEWLAAEAARTGESANAILRRALDQAIDQQGAVPSCVSCGRPFSPTVAYSGGSQKGPLCNECF